MIRRLTSTVLLLQALAINANTLELNCVPGGLEGMVPSPETVTELVLRGNIDASDLYYISSAMTSLKSLDISAAGISPCTIDNTTWAASTIPPSIFAGSGLEKIALPAYGATTVGDCAFMGSALREVEVRYGEVHFGLAAFAGCGQLRKVVLGGDVRSEGYLFQRCALLESADLSGLAAVGDHDFADCLSLAQLSGTGGLRSIGREAFARTALSDVDLSGSKRLESIGDWAFSGNLSLRSAALPATGTTLGEGLFFGCTALEALSLPESGDVIPAYMLAGVSSLESVKLPAGLVSVGESAMEGAVSLSTVDAHALRSVPQTGGDVWRSVDQPSASLIVDPSVASLFRQAPQWKEFDIKEYSGISSPSPVAGVSARFEGKELIVTSDGSILRSVALFDIAGRDLLRCYPDTDRAEVDTSHLVADIFIVLCGLDDGRTVSFKLIRNN